MAFFVVLRILSNNNSSDGQVTAVLPTAILPTTASETTGSVPTPVITPQTTTQFPTPQPAATATPISAGEKQRPSTAIRNGRFI